MNGIAKSLLFAVLLGFCGTSPCADADTIYASINISAGNPANRIERFDSSGGPGAVFATGTYGALAISPAGTLYATGTNNTIYRFDSSGNASLFADSSSGLNIPCGIAFDGNSNLFVVNGASATVEEFDPAGTSSVFAASGLVEPMGIAFDDSGNLYVSNQGNGRITKFDPNGTGTVFAGGLSTPFGLAFFGGNLYVANDGNNSILKINPGGQKSTFTSTNLMQRPFGLAFDSSGNLFVANPGNGTILKFDQSGAGSVFASGLVAPVWLAIAVPEPSSLLLTALGAMSLWAVVKRKREQGTVLR